MGKKNPDKSPARARYWGSGKLKKRKIRNIMKNTGCSEKEAESIWTDGYPSHPATIVKHFGNVTKRVPYEKGGKQVNTRATTGRKRRH